MGKIAAIYYDPAGYETGGEKLMGRQVANAGLLTAIARAAGGETIPCLVKKPADGEAFDRVMQHAAPGATTSAISFQQIGRLSGPGCLFWPDPGIRDLARLRLATGWRRFSLCGVTHTTASRWAMDQIADLAIEPFAPWDALVCTSRSVRDTARQLVEARAEYLRWRLGTARPWLPQLPLIPLGVDCEAMHIGPDERQSARRELGIGPDEVVFLFVGRLSYHAKANPLPMLRALGAVAAQGRRLRLIQCGWFINDSVRRLYHEATAAFCPGVPIAYLDGRDADTRRTAWAAADIFTSLVDNIQETFGLTPIEAMAAGLPSVVSDWDGYRDTVRHRVDGLRVRTLTPAPGDGQSIADSYADGRLNYDYYCGFTSQFISVDLEETIAAYAQLADDPDLRRRLGASAQLHARETYDWSVIAKAYMNLWAELEERRRADPAPDTIAPPQRYPTQLDPFRLFRSYPTRALRRTDMVQLRTGESTHSLAELLKVPLVGAGRGPGPNDAEIQAIMAVLDDGTAHRVAEILGAFPEQRRPTIRRGLVWLAKLGVAAITRPR